jgi:peptidoglycan/LPS O-acetylase OafA/YrhL
MFLNESKLAQSRDQQDSDGVYAVDGSSRPSNFFSNLEAARGIAALMVALFHIGLTPYIDALGHQQRLVVRTAEASWSDYALRILGNGPGAVIFFFILSGFVLTKVLENGPRDLRRNAWKFLSGRVFRIYPAVVSTLILFCALFFAGGYALTSPDEFSPVNLILNALLVRPTIDSVMWSLQLEMIAAPMILLIYFAWLQFGARAVLAPYLILLVLSFTSVWNHLIGSPNSFGQIYAFLSGMAAFLYGRRIVDGLRRPGAWLSLAIIGFAITRPIVGWSSYWTILLETLFGAATVALLAFGPFQAPGSRLLLIARFFGKISFSFYLLNPITLFPQQSIGNPLAAAVTAGFHPSTLCIILFLCSVVITTPLAWMQYHFVERRFIGLGRGLQQAKIRVLGADLRHSASTYPARET